MKVLLINGSPRKEGNTATALAEVARQLAKEGIESEIVWIGNKPIRGCAACGQCAAKGLGRCVFDDDICNRISEKFAEANALIVGSPVYYAHPSGRLISFMDRVFYVDSMAKKRTFYLKPAATVISARRAGTTATFDQINKYYKQNKKSHYFSLIF